jgi:hypothetical protein
LRSTFSSSRLQRLLAAHAPMEMNADGPDFAERLSLWVNAFDAIGLQSAQQGIQAIRTAAGGQSAEPTPARLHAIEEDVRWVRATLTQAIAQDPESLHAGQAAYQHRHLELQRHMEQAIGPLRERTRQAIAQVSPSLHKLAALDALFEHLLAAREQALLPTTASLLERRQTQLRAQPSPNEPDGAPGYDPQAFPREWRQALLAELDLRLEPVTGLVAALANELNERP